MSDTLERPYHHGQLRPALLAAAERHLREHGKDQLSLRELAREVGVSHAAPRRHFPDRQALLNALAETGFERLGAELSSALAEAGDDYEARLRTTVASYVRFATANAALLELMFARKHEAGADHVVAAADAPFALMRDLIIEGQSAGVLDSGDPQRVGVVLFATVHGIAALINGDMVSADHLDGLVDTAVDQFIRGAGPA